MDGQGGRAMEDFRQRRAVVTGAASGIGLAVARRLLAGGATVSAVDRNAEGLHAIGITGRKPGGPDPPVPPPRPGRAGEPGGVDYLSKVPASIAWAPLGAVKGTL